MKKLLSISSIPKRLSQQRFARGFGNGWGPGPLAIVLALSVNLSLAAEINSGSGRPAAPAASASVSASTLATSSTKTSAAPSPSSTRPQRIGFVDIDAIIQESRAVREHIGRIEDEFEVQRREIERKTAEYRRLRESLDRQSSVLTDAEKETRRKRIADLRGEIDDLQYRADRLLKRSENTLLAPIMEGILRVVDEVGRREGFDLILRGETVLFGTDSTNLTDRILAEIDRRGLPELDDFQASGNSPRSSSASPAEADGSTSPSSSSSSSHRRRAGTASAPLDSLPLLP